MIFFIMGSVEASSVNLIKVDQFGYLPNAEKVAVISDPQKGFNSDDSVDPKMTYEVRSVTDANFRHATTVKAWGGGATHALSGDKVWWVDFSDLSTEGEYYLSDSNNTMRSENFKISNDVYKDVMQHALRSYFYQRSNFAKQAPYADPKWQDAASHSSATRALLLDPSSSLSEQAETQKDVSRGWYDAGDYNKYINNADGAVHELLLAYEENPSVWSDDFDLSSENAGTRNGVPDLLDEVKWELDWFLNMQTNVGSVLHKVSALNHGGQTSPPSSNGNGSYVEKDCKYNNYADPNDDPRYACEQLFYAPATASATISATAVYAHAAKVYLSLESAEMQAYGAKLKTAALAGWKWLVDHPESIPSHYGIDTSKLTKITDAAPSSLFLTGFATTKAEDCQKKTKYDAAGNPITFEDTDKKGTKYERKHKYYDCSQQLGNQVIAAVYLYALTGDAEYNTYIKQNATNKSRLLNSNFDERYLNSDGFNEEFQNGLLYYSALDNADTTLATTIRENFQTLLQRNNVEFSPLKFLLQEKDAYRAHIDGYSWGSNRAISHGGNALLNALTYQTSADSSQAAIYRNGAAGYLHYLHGVNPLNQAYLSNMQAVGADNSVDEFYHRWFQEGSQWDNVNNSNGPAPGFLVGGATQFYSGSGYMDDVQNSSHLINNQPEQKRFLASNSIQNAYKLSENSITYQAPYIRLLSKFLTDSNTATSTGNNTTTTVETTPSNQITPEIETIVGSQWEGGYCVDINVKPTKSINDWEFTLQLGDSVFGGADSIWSSNSSDLGNHRFQVKPVTWNHLIFGGGSAGVSFCANGSAEDIVISDAKGYTYPVQYAKEFESLRVDMWIDGLWSDSYCLAVNITNLTNSAVKWKEVRLTLDDSILDQGWSGNYAMEGKELVITPADWNADLGLGQDTTVGFCAKGKNNLSISSATIQ